MSRFLGLFEKVVSIRGNRMICYRFFFGFAFIERTMLILTSVFLIS